MRDTILEVLLVWSIGIFVLLKNPTIYRAEIILCICLFYFLLTNRHKFNILTILLCLLLAGAICAIMYGFDYLGFGLNDIRTLLGFFPIFIIFMALIYSKIQSRIKILSLVIRNVFKASGKQRLNSAADNHSSVFLKAYWKNFVGVLILLSVIALVSCKVTLLLSPFLIIENKADVWSGIISMGTLYAVALYLVFEENSFHLADTQLKWLRAGSFVLLIFVAFFNALGAFAIVVGLEWAAFYHIRRKLRRG